jgi:polyisoprenyl-phosphate glycosyltransferase
MSNVDISIIIPVYNEEEVLDIFFDRMNPIMKSLSQYTYEYLFINDGSTDKTLDILREYNKKDSHIKVISLSRNFRKEACLFCGLENTSGNAIILMDVDLQDPPELIKEFVKKWEEGYKVVYGVRANRKEDSFLKRFSAKMFYKTYNFLAERPIPYNTGDFRLMDKMVVSAILSLNERVLFMKGLLSWVGFKSVGVEYQRPERVAGKTKWNYWKLWNFAWDGITSSTTVPIKIWSYLGVFLVSLFIIAALYLVSKHIFMLSETLQEALELFLAVFFGSLQLVALGIIGEYIARISSEIKRRPLYIIEEKIGM